jgi:Domain of unknown function (DUF3854)
LKVLSSVYPYVLEVFENFGELASADFARRGLTVQTARTCFIQHVLVECLSRPQQDPFNRSPLAGNPSQFIRMPEEHEALRISYFYAGDSSGLEVYLRYRFLGELPSVPQCKKKADGTNEWTWKPSRYLGPKGETASRLYIPPLLIQKWPGILQDANRPLMLTEGELKAVTSTQEGYPTIAIGGVWMGTIGTKESGFRLIPDFDWINLKGRKIFICFDSDRATNWQVRAAERRLEKALFGSGARVHTVKLDSLGVARHG